MSDCKHCPRCGEVKPLDAFGYYTHAGVTRPHSYCRECARRRMRERRQAMRGIRRELQRESNARGR